MSAKRDALKTAQPFEFEGETYTAPASSEWDLDVLEALEEGRMIAAVKALVGPEQYARFRAKHSKIADLEAFMEALQGAVGAGN
jgi:hypothetical protein